MADATVASHPLNQMVPSAEMDDEQASEGARLARHSTTPCFIICSRTTLAGMLHRPPAHNASSHAVEAVQTLCSIGLLEHHPEPAGVSADLSRRKKAKASATAQHRQVVFMLDGSCFQPDSRPYCLSQRQPVVDASE